MRDYSKAFPRWRYSKLTLTAGANYFAKKTDFGYNYWLHGLVISYTDNGEDTDIAPCLDIELIQPARNLALIQDYPDMLPVPLISSPAGKMPGNRDRDLYLYYAIDYIYDGGDIVTVKLTRNSPTIPETARCLMIGRNIRDRKEYSNDKGYSI